LIQTADPTTLHMAVLLGLVCLAAGIGALVSPGDWPEVMAELDGSPTLTLAIAFAAIVFGAFVILFHRSWSDPLAVVVSLIGWASFAEGLLLLGLPRLYVRLARPMARYARHWGAFALLLGAFLLSAGLTGRPPPLN
jgi:uncharacterized protein YjeT (DUF2065 family)